MNEATELAWGIISNAYGGDWGQANDDWRGAAERWRDVYVGTQADQTCGHAFTCPVCLMGASMGTLEV